MNILRAAIAVLEGFKLCLFTKEIRKLAMWPWLVGAVTYIIVAFIAINLHGSILDWLVGVPEGFWQSALYYLAWLGVTLFLLICTLIVSLVTAMILTGVFQTAIAENVLRLNGVDVPSEEGGAKAVAKEVTRSIVTESTKLFWLVPVMIIALVLGFIPILAPIGIVLASWILAFESLDVVLDIFKIRTRKRFAFARSHALSVTVFGLTLTACGLIPLLGLLLPPIAVAGAAWLASAENVLSDPALVEAPAE